MLPYTSTQFDREVQLMIHQLVTEIDLTLGDGAGCRALNIEESSDYGQGRHPDYLTELYSYDVYRKAKIVEAYVHEQRWDDQLKSALNSLIPPVEHAFSPETVASYEAEREAYPEEAIPDPGEDRAGEVVLGHFYQGLLLALIERASARLKLDMGERLTMSDVAVLIDSREATVATNAHRKNFPSVLDDDNRRYAEAVDVLPWLIKNGYKPTLKAGEPSGPRLIVEGEEYVVVPVGKGGVWFDPASIHNGRYIIGVGQTERRYADYYEALDHLMKLPTPRWQTKRGDVRGVAFAIRFDRVPRARIDSAIAAIAKPA